MKESNEQISIISLSDLIQVLTKSWKIILLGAFACASLIAYWSLNKPIQYTVTASFKESSNSGSSLLGGSLKELLMTGSQQNSGASSLMLSQQILPSLIQKLGLQASFTKDVPTSPVLGNVSENLSVFSAKLRKTDEFSLAVPDPKNDLICKNLTYSGEFPLHLTLSFKDENTYVLHKGNPSDKNTEEYGRGKLNKLFLGKDFVFSLEKTTDQSIISNTYTLFLSPLSDTMTSLESRILIGSSSSDSSLLEIKTSHRDRHLAAKIINQLMGQYKLYLKSENIRRSHEQLSYLERRQGESNDNLDVILNKHCAFLENNLSGGGFVLPDQEANYLAGIQEGWKTKLFELNLETELLNQGILSPDILLKNKLYNVDRNEGTDPIQPMLARIRDLSLQRDTLEHLLNENGNKKNGQNNAVTQAALGKINGRLSIMDKHLNHYINSLQSSNSYHTDLINKRLGELNDQMASIPKKWLFNQQLNFNMAMNESIMAKVTELVESTIISSNLETIESKAINIAIPPTKPNTPKFLLLGVAGFFLGAGLTAFGVTVNSFLKGLPASKENLSQFNQKSAGELSIKIHKLPLDSASNEDISTLRNIISATGSLSKRNNRLLLILGNGPDYSQSLAKLYSKMGKRPLIVELPTHTRGHHKESSGLLQFLEEKVELPKIIDTHDGYHRINSGGSSPFTPELLAHQRFEKLLMSLENDYDLVILVNHANVKNIDIQYSRRMVNSSIISIVDETLQDLEDFTQPPNTEDRNQQNIFLFSK
jgi:uncharacterized protein involved in exopolysaccharide biosynthesis